MIHFVVVVGTPGAVERLVPRLRHSLDRTGLFEGERLERIGASRTWAVAAVAAPDPTCSTRLAADEDAMIVFNGAALSTGGDQTRVAEDVLQAFRSGGSAAVSAALGGTYNFVGVAPSTGLRAFVDFSGLLPLYRHEGPDFAVFSNRSTTIADLVGSEGWDLRALAWVVGHANLFADRMPVRDVSYLPPGREARVAWGTGRVDIDLSPGWVWPAPSDEPGRENLAPAEWDEITDALVTNFRALCTFDGPLRLRLSGGKDSRLCLALAKAAGLQDRIETMTAGGPDSPEVEVAAAVAHAAGFSHKRPSPPPPAVDAVQTPPVFDPDTVWRHLRQNAYRYEGIVSAWSGLANPWGSTPTLDIKGVGGELYRRGNSKQFRRKHVMTVDTLSSMIVNYAPQVHDPLGILQRHEAAFQTDWLTAWVHTAAEQVRLDLLPEKFYVDHRLGHWSGPLLQATPGRINVNPLVLSTAAKKNCELSMEARSSERFHFEVMRRAAPELVVVPFLNDVWAAEIAADSPIDLPGDPYAVAVKPTKRALTQRHTGWPFLASEGKAITALFKDAARGTEMGAICDMKKLRRIARHSARLTKMGEIKALVNTIGVALTLLGRAEPVLDQPQAPARTHRRSSGN